METDTNNKPVEAPTQDESTPTQDRRSLFGPWVWIVAIAIVTLFGGWYVWMSITRGTELSETDAWARVSHYQAKGDVDSMQIALRDYLWTYSDGKYAADAKNMQTRLETETDAWESLLKNNPDPVKVDEFLYTFPDGMYRQLALELIDSLSFTTAADAGSDDALLDYMDNFPNGRFVRKAHAMLQKSMSSPATENELDVASKIIEQHFALMQSGDEKIAGTMAEVISSYIGKPSPEVADVIAYMRHFNKGGKNKKLTATDFSVQKMPTPDGAVFNVSFTLTVQTDDGNDETDDKLKKYSGTAILDHTMHISSLLLAE